MQEFMIQNAPFAILALLLPAGLILVAGGGLTGRRPAESAVAGLAALICARNQPQLSAALGLDQSSRIYLLGTEGATDPELYQRLVSTPD